MAADPAKWGPIIAGLPAETRPPRELPKVMPPPPPAPEPPLPSLARRAANLAGAMVEAASHAVATGEVLASQSVQAARWRVCENGEGLQADQVTDGHCDRFRPSDGACSECGCNLRYKITLAAMACPLGRWKE